MNFDHVSAVNELSWTGKEMGMKRGYDDSRWLVLVPILCVCVFKHPSINDPIIMIPFLFSKFAPLCCKALQSVTEKVSMCKQSVNWRDLSCSILSTSSKVSSSIDFFLYADV